MTVRWTKVRERYLALVAAPVREHIGIHIARYRGAHDREGRGWISWDGVELASFETIPYLTQRYTVQTARAAAGAEDDPEELEAAAREGGRLPLWDLTSAVEAYPNLSLEEAIRSPDPVIRGLAMLDRRLGKRRLLTLSLRDDEPPFVRHLYELRRGMEATGGKGPMV